MRSAGAFFNWGVWRPRGRSLGDDADFRQADHQHIARFPIEPQAVERRLGQVKDASRTLKKLEHAEHEAAHIVNAAETATGGCFVAGTEVATPEGLRPIESIHVGDTVLSRNQVTGELEARRVDAVQVKHDRAVVQITVETADGALETLVVTPNHPFWLEDHWTVAGDLRSGDQLDTADGRDAFVESNTALPGGETTYNLNVNGLHTYFVGEAELWVHNSNPVSCAQGAVDELKQLGPLKDRHQAHIEKDLAERGYSPTKANSGGSVWTKPGADGHTASVRLDPAVERTPPKGWADEAAHAHKETVPTGSVSQGNYHPSQATKLNDAAEPALSTAEAHIPIKTD